VAIYSAHNGTNIIPDAATIFEEWDKIIILGSREQLESLEKMTLTLD
jgi:Trk K+ transport system NAD-binding subunit